MEELKFPVFDEPLPPPRRLSMEEYLAFVQFVIRNTPHLEKIRERKLARQPRVRFKLRFTV